MSCSNPLEGRGRDRAAHRAASWACPQVFRTDFADRWSRLIRQQCRSREEVSSRFEVTFQTGCNWWDGGICRPSGDKVALAALWWPEAFRTIIGGGC